MYAIVDVKDKQFKVREDDTLYVPYHSDAEADQELTLDRVLLVSDEEGDVTLGTPTVEDATVHARVLEHVKGDKVIVFKKKRRKRYRVKRGHRQQYTQIQIESLLVNGERPTAVSSETADTATSADTEDPTASSETEDTAASSETKETTDVEPASDPDAEAEDASDEAPPEPDTAAEDESPVDAADTPEDTTSEDTSGADDESAADEPSEADASIGEGEEEEDASAGTDAVDEAFSDDNPFDQDTAFSEEDPFEDDENDSDAADESKDESKSDT